MGDDIPVNPTPPAPVEVDDGATGENENKNVSSEDALEKYVVDGKNKLTLQCCHCPSKIMEPMTAIFCKEDKMLPKMSQKKDRTTVEVDQVSEWFVVEDIMTFENIGVSNAVDQTKYLICADCEMGPVGWTDLSNKKCFVALSRVRQL